MQLSRALSDLVKYTKSVGTHDVDSEGEGAATRGPRGGPGGRPGPPDAAAAARSGVRLAGVVLQRGQGPADAAAEAGPVPALQPAAADPRLPLALPRGLEQLQPAALLERRLPDGWAPRAAAPAPAPALRLPGASCPPALGGALRPWVRGGQPGRAPGRLARRRGPACARGRAVGPPFTEASARPTGLARGWRETRPRADRATSHPCLQSP